jgi:hypothetical protein
MMNTRITGAWTSMSILIVLTACGSDEPALTPMDPDTAPRAVVDRFSEAAGMLFVRTTDNGLPEADEPVDFDSGPFITQGLGPNGEIVRYYNFDVQPVETAPIFVLRREGASSPVEGQLNIVDVIPGDSGYSDFWHVHLVTVPAEYVANTVTSFDEIEAAGYEIERTNMIVNCPVVPAGSTATLRHEDGDTGLVRGWYRGAIVQYFEFAEHPLVVEPPAEGHPSTPLSPIYVMFDVNPDESDPTSGPASGFRTEADATQTHNVVATLPGDAGYSPLWMVNVLDNVAFDDVMDLESATAATILGSPANVNCPIVEVR